MKTIRSGLHWMFVFALLAITSASFAQPAADTTKTYRSKSGKLSVKLTVSDASCEASPHWLNEGRSTTGCIAGIQVFRDGAEAYFPAFTFKFLSRPESVAIGESGRGYVLRLAGGDAGSSYIATFLFEQDSLKRRRITSAAFPDEAWEESTFKFNSSNR